MKIIVDGNLIDTEFIYKISDVYASQYHTQVYQNNDTCTYIGNSFTITYAFRIDFINKNHLDVILHKFYGDKLTGTVDMEWYEIERKSIYNKVEKLKNEVQEVWLENQTDIPKFNFE